VTSFGKRNWVGVGVVTTATPCVTNFSNSGEVNCRNLRTSGVWRVFLALSGLVKSRVSERFLASKKVFSGAMVVGLFNPAKLLTVETAGDPREFPVLTPATETVGLELAELFWFPAAIEAAADNKLRLSVLAAALLLVDFEEVIVLLELEEL
jgi:hypothetical protein